MKTAALLTAVLLLGGCQTTTPGWSPAQRADFSARAAWMGQSLNSHVRAWPRPVGYVQGPRNSYPVYAY